MKRKVEDDKADDRQRRKDRIWRRILAAEEKRRFVDGVPSESDANASEEETVWVLSERNIKPDRRTRELQKVVKQVEDELEAEYKDEDDSDSDDLDIHPDFTNGSDSDSDEEEDSEKDDDESDKSDDSDESDDNSVSSRNEPRSKHEVEASISENNLLQDNQKNPSSSHNSRHKRTVRAPARYRSSHTEAGTSVDVHVVVDAGKRRDGESVVMVDDSSNRVDEESTDSVEAVIRYHVREYPTAGLQFEAPMINTSPNNEVVGGFVIPKCHAPLYTKIGEDTCILLQRKYGEAFSQPPDYGGRTVTDR
ncbi:protein starmaker-like [Papaver somniferum]|uniref:protein starmaker-like n=1 Tax=Papaver somniferum TaxID=3469 RepID=UPI000E6FD9D2|nr:protein starmaker-like [Papaver somniferum]